jgi:multisubunit Na+/H+ antiporter MnhC subunit
VAVPTATDNCSGLVDVSSDANFPISTPGTTVITWTYTDANGNNTTQTQNIIISDTIAPTPDDVILSDITAECELQQADITVPTASDNCSGTIIATGDGVFPITASTTITWTYTDAAGNVQIQTQQVIIEDTTDPIPDVAILTVITAQCEVIETDVTIPTATDNCSTVTVTSDAVFPITETTTIVWTYTDASGNSESQTQLVTINDATPPVPDAVVLADITAECEVAEADVPVPTATDNCAGVISITTDADFPITAQGTTVITWTFTDGNDNSTMLSQNIIINDNTVPVPDDIVLDDITAECEVLATDVIAPTASDNCSGTVIGITDAVFPITTSTTITWTYTDANGNSQTQSQQINIADSVAPTPDVVVLTNITAQCEVQQTDVTVPSATDNCSGVVNVTSDAVFPITAQGTTVITWTYTDASGNSTTQTQDVTITDDTDPTVTLADLTVSIDVTGTATIIAAQLENGTASDNCGIATITVAPDSFTCEELGDHLVTVTVTDIHGNSVSETATVTVTDPSEFCALATTQHQAIGFTLYPNPTADKLYIIPGSKEILRSAALYSLTGQLIWHGAYPVKADRYTISLEPYAQGTYLLKLETASGNSVSRIVKQ